jgi:hypothetical protein
VSTYILGVRIDHAPNGTVIGSSDWDTVCRWALNRSYNLRYSDEPTATHKIVLDRTPYWP